MCGPTKITAKPPVALSKTWIGNGILIPLHPSIAVAAMSYALPTGAYLNRGFTVWFHLASVLQVLTQSKFLVQMLALNGASICLGWYASLLFEFVWHGRWCHALYKNMPQVLVDSMVPDAATGLLDFESTESLLAMGVCHVLDLLGHPLLTYYFWRKSQRDNNYSIAWPVVLASYCFSRCWSLVHTYHNFGKPRLWYFGFDVYTIDSLDAWYPAYIIEGMFYTGVVLYKLTQSRYRTKQ